MLLSHVHLVTIYGETEPGDLCPLVTLVHNLNSIIFLNGTNTATGYPLKLDFQIPCVFPVQPLFSVPMYVICDYY